MRYGITSIALFIEKGEKALKNMGDDRRYAYAVMQEGDRRDDNIATITELVQLKKVLAELKSGANGGLHTLLYRLESDVCNMSARVLEDYVLDSNHCNDAEGPRHKNRSAVDLRMLLCQMKQLV